MQPKPSLAGAVSLPAPAIHPYHKQQPPLPREAPPLIRIKHEYTNPYLGHLQHRHFPWEGNGLLCWKYFLGIMEGAQAWADWKPAAAPPGGKLCMHSQPWARQWALSISLWIICGVLKTNLSSSCVIVQGDLWKILCRNWRLFFAPSSYGREAWEAWRNDWKLSLNVTVLL